MSRARLQGVEVARQASARTSNMQDVAARAGVAVSSVSRVLSRHPDVSEPMRQRVMQAVEELRYEPDLLAQSLRNGSTKMVGLLVRDISNPLFAQISRGAEERLRAAGHMMVVANSNGDASVEAEHINLLRRRRVDGVIASLVADRTAKSDAALAQFQGPVVLIDRENEPRSAGSVTCDHYTGVRAAVDDLLTAGHRRIALITGTPAIWPTRERVRGYEDAHAAHRVPVSKRLIVTGQFEVDFARRATEKLLASATAPTAIVAGGIQCSEGVLLALGARKLRVGRDLAFVACDDFPMRELISPGAGIVHRDAFEMGRRAADVFLAVVAGEPPQTPVVPTTYVRGDLAVRAAKK